MKLSIVKKFIVINKDSGEIIREVTLFEFICDAIVLFPILLFTKMIRSFLPETHPFKHRTYIEFILYALDKLYIYSALLWIEAVCIIVLLKIFSTQRN